jgi:hypothetical protein
MRYETPWIGDAIATRSAAGSIGKMGAARVLEAGRGIWSTVAQTGLMQIV